MPIASDLRERGNLNLFYEIASPLQDANDRSEIFFAPRNDILFNAFVSVHYGSYEFVVDGKAQTS